MHFLRKKVNDMYYVIFGLPVAFVFAALQVVLCEKTEKKWLKFLPIFSATGVFLLAEFIRGENLLASAVYGILGQGIFALIVLLWILGIGAGAGSIIGWGIFFIKNKGRKQK